MSKSMEPIKGKLPASGDSRKTTVPVTQRAHPHGTVQSGAKILASPAAAIDARQGAVKNTQREYMAHRGTTSELQRSPGGRGQPSQGIAPAQPITANPSTPRPTKAAPLAFGMEHRNLKPGEGPHVRFDPGSGNKVLDEATFSGSARMPGERHHSCDPDHDHDCGDNC